MPRKKSKVESEAGQLNNADKAESRSPVSLSLQASGEGQRHTDVKSSGEVPSPSRDMSTLCAEIRAWHRRRCFAMDQRKRVDLALGSFLRTQLGWRLDQPEADRKRIAKGASDLIECGEKIAAYERKRAKFGMPDQADRHPPASVHPLADTDEYQEWAVVIAAAIASRLPWDEIETQAKKQAAALAEQLPAWEAFGKDIRGFGPASLAVIVGEAGDLSIYASKSKLWKRMGLAVMDGVRQGGLGKGSSKELWIEHGYSRVRRSRMWNIGDAFIKSNQNGAYRTAYLKRKEYEIARDPEIKPIKAHRRAQRYMEKRLLRDLWQSWRACKRVAYQPSDELPAEIRTNNRAQPFPDAVSKKAMEDA